MAKESGIVATLGGRLNVRAAPGGDVIGALQNGSAVTILTEGDAWHEIAFGGGRAYAAAAYIRRNDTNRKKTPRVRITDAAGSVFEPEGAFTVEALEA